jgi:hypothetical protein
VYRIALGPIVYSKRGGAPFTLTEALRELYGCGQARIVRLDGTVAVRNAGSDYAVEHAPTGRTVRRRPVRR